MVNVRSQSRWSYNITDMSSIKFRLEIIVQLYIGIWFILIIID